MVKKGYLIIFLLWYHVKYLNTSLHLIWQQATQHKWGDEKGKLEVLVTKLLGYCGSSPCIENNRMERNTKSDINTFYHLNMYL